MLISRIFSKSANHEPPFESSYYERIQRSRFSFVISSPEDGNGTMKNGVF
jgi:hypothetical protein